MRTQFAFALASAVALATPVMAQQDGNGPAAKSDTTTSTGTVSKPSNLPPITLQHIRPNDKRGVNVFEAPKDDATPFTGFKLGFGAAFTQQFQGLGHTNTAAANVVNGVNANQLMDIGMGFNNPTANVNLHAQLAPGREIAARERACQHGPAEKATHQESQGVAGQDGGEANRERRVHVEDAFVREVSGRNQRDILGDRQAQAAQQEDGRQPQVRPHRGHGREMSNEPLHAVGPAMRPCEIP